MRGLTPGLIGLLAVGLEHGEHESWWRSKNKDRRDQWSIVPEDRCLPSDLSFPLAPKDSIRSILLKMKPLAGGFVSFMCHVPALFSEASGVQAHGRCSIATDETSGPLPVVFAPCVVTASQVL